MLHKGDEPVPGYRIEEFLGRGQFGEVWRATGPGRAPVALKFIMLNDRQAWKEFHAIQRVKSIRHPHLAPTTALWLLDGAGNVVSDDVLDSFQRGQIDARETLRPTQTERVHPERLVMATLLCDQSLADRLEECRAEGVPGIPVDELLRYMDEAAKGIDFLNTPHHRISDTKLAVQHCDIKPANLLLAGRSVLICDFGLARVLADSKSAATGTSITATLAYMPPEIFDKKPSIASDQYSLAVSYVELRTGELPFASQSYVDVLQAHQTGTLDLSRLPAAEAAVIRKATSVSPGHRYRSASEMVKTLHAAVHAPPPPPVQARRARRWPWSSLRDAVSGANSSAAVSHDHRLWVRAKLDEGYLHLTGSKKDAKRAVECFRAAAPHEPMAMNNLGVCLIRGQGCAADVVLGVHCLRLAAKSNVAGSVVSLAWIFSHGVAPFGKDVELALELSVLAADLTSPQARIRAMAVKRLPSVLNRLPNPST